MDPSAGFFEEDSPEAGGGGSGGVVGFCGPWVCADTENGSAAASAIATIHAPMIRFFMSGKNNCCAEAAPLLDTIRFALLSSGLAPDHD